MKQLRGVITCILARHVNEAMALGRSIRLNSPGLHTTCVVEGELSRSEATRLSDVFDVVKPLRAEHQKMGWLVKHVVIDYAEANTNLFLDSDCLVMKPLQPAFETAGEREICFAAKLEPVQETGAFLYAGISLEKLMGSFGVDWWPQILGGGHFFFRNSPTARRLFERALYWGQPDVIAPFGWSDRARIAPDEITLQMALAEAKLHRACALAGYPLVCWTPWESARPDTFTGQISLRDRLTGKRHWDSGYFVAHFGGDAGNRVYRREQLRLAFAGRGAGRLLGRASKPPFEVYSYTSLKVSRLRARLKQAVPM
jgi:hypothetical protein